MEFAYLLFFLSGIIKSILIHFNINFPVDFTVFTVILLIIAVIFDKSYHSFRFKLSKRFGVPLLILIAFYIYMLISLLYTASPHYSFEKTGLFFLNIIAFIFPFLIKNFNIKRFLRYIVFSIILISIYFAAILQAIRHSVNRDLQFIGLYLVLSTYLGIIAVFLFTTKEKFFFSKKVDYLIGLLSLGIILLLGARGPLLFAILIILFYGFASFLLKPPRNNAIRNTLGAVVIIIVIGGVAGFVFHKKVKPLLEHSLKRLELLTEKTTNPKNKSVAKRIEQYKFTIDYITSDFIVFIAGNGIGSFNILYKGVDGRGYPHNNLLEIWFELGVIGVVIFYLFLCSIFCQKQSNPYINHLLLVFILLNMLKSGSIIDIRNYFIFFALFLLKNPEK